jgi:hypothetical protein
VAHIRKKGPSLVVDYRDTREKGRSKSFRTKAEARRFEAAVETAKNRGEWTNPKGARTPFTEWADRYLETCPNLGDATVARAQSLMRCHVRPGFEGATLGTIKLLHVQGWVNHLDSQGLSASTVTGCYRLLGQDGVGGKR